MHVVRREVGCVVTWNVLLGAALARLFFLAFQMESSARLASLGDSAMLDDGWFRLGVVFVVAKGVSFEKISTRKGFGADLTLVRFLLSVHADVPGRRKQVSSHAGVDGVDDQLVCRYMYIPGQVIEARIALATAAATVQSRIGGALGRCVCCTSVGCIASIDGSVRSGGGAACCGRGGISGARALGLRLGCVVASASSGRGVHAGKRRGVSNNGAVDPMDGRTSERVKWRRKRWSRY